MAIFFSRDTKVYLEWTNSSVSPVGIWEIPVLDGFSFSQGINTSEITLSEASTNSGQTSKRGRVLFNDSLAPVEWSFTTYMRPFISAGTGPAGGGADDSAGHHGVEEALWAAFCSNATYNGAAGTPIWSTGLSTNASPAGMLIDFDDSNRPALATFNLYFSFDDASAGRQVYRLNSAVVNNASIDFDIEGLAQITWSGFAATISDQATTQPTRNVYEAVTSTNNFIRHRLTELTLVPAAGSPFNTNYNNIVLTGGNITFDNGISYLTPEELGVVNQPLEHVTGPRSITGNFTAYLDTAANAIGDLYEDLVQDTTTAQNSFYLKFFIGGVTGTPRVEIEIPQAHLEIPVHQTEDVLGMEAAFHALGTGIDQTDEATLVYVGA